MQKYDFWTIFDPQRGFKNHLGAAFWLKKGESSQRRGKPETIFELFGPRFRSQDDAGSDFRRFWRGFRWIFEEFWTLKAAFGSIFGTMLDRFWRHFGALERTR